MDKYGKLSLNYHLIPTVTFCSSGILQCGLMWCGVASSVTLCFFDSSSYLDAYKKN